jgi:hypothetical protein
MFVKKDPELTKDLNKDENLPFEVSSSYNLILVEP